MRSGYFAGHRLRYKNLFCWSLVSSHWTLALELGYRRIMDVRVRVWVGVKSRVRLDLISLCWVVLHLNT